MKVKKLLGENINGFKILDTYQVELPSGAKTRKVLLRCEKCGREFERNSGVDFDHIKCKCMCAPEKPTKFKFIEWQGKQYTQTDFCKLHKIGISTFRSRIESGMSIEDAIKKKFSLTCKLCGKPFTADRPDVKYCSTTCRNRSAHGKGKYKEPYTAKCVVCGSEFEAVKDNAKTCSQHCRESLARIDRNRRYKNLKHLGKFDESVTLENVYKKFNGICQNCGKHLTFEPSCLSNDYPSIDHIQPLSKGGTHEWKNIQLLCRRCNCVKADAV